MFVHWFVCLFVCLFIHSSFVHSFIFPSPSIFLFQLQGVDKDFAKLGHEETVDLTRIKQVVKRSYTSLLAQYQTEEANIDIAVSMGTSSGGIIGGEAIIGLHSSEHGHWLWWDYRGGGHHWHT